MPRTRAPLLRPLAGGLGLSLALSVMLVRLDAFPDLGPVGQALLLAGVTAIGAIAALPPAADPALPPEGSASDPAATPG